MPHLLPEAPYFAHPSEREVWEALRAQLPPDVYLIGSLHIEDPDRGPIEADLLVIWPEQGIAVIEIKGGHVTITGNGEWRQTDQNEQRPIDPFGQAKRARDALHKWVKKLNLPAMRMAAVVVLPHSFLPGEFDHIDEPRTNIVDRADIATIADKVHAAITRVVSGPQPPSHASAERLAKSLLKGLLDPNDLQTMGRLVEDRNTQVEALVRSQEQLLENLRLVTRFEVRGAAGTGKTALALSQARRLTMQGQKILLVCYNRLLARDLRRRTESWPHEERPAVVKNFHDLAATWHRREPEEPNNEYFEVQAARLLLEVAQHRADSEKFDAIVVDEAQDFAGLWWDALVALLRDSDKGGIYAFGDDDQRIFHRDAGENLGLVPVVLTTNLRNTKPIASSAASMISNPPRLLDFDGAPVIFIDCPREDAIDHADSMVEHLFDDWEPSNIVLMTTGDRHPVHDELLQRPGSVETYERSLWEESDVFYTHAMKFKGLERPAVVIAVNGFQEHTRPGEVLYVALTRARDLCIICGDAKEIEEIVGPEVMAGWQRRAIPE